MKLIRPIIFGLLLLTFAASKNVSAQVKLLNVSYDPTRELYRTINSAFSAEWQKKTGQTLKIDQSHGGSSKQARSVIDGLEADVVTLGLGYDIDVMADKGLLPQDWQAKLPHNSAPYTSTIVFLVRKGNPKGVRDWPDLVKPGLQVITPNPKTSGGGRWAYLAAWGDAYRRSNKDETKAREFVAALYRNVPVLDSGARASTTTFVEREIGDVLIAWENEAYLALQEFGAGKFEIVTPPESILAEPPVAVVEKFAQKHHTTDVAKAYLDFLYSETVQEIIGKNFYRPISPKALAKYSGQFKPVKLYSFQSIFGTWRQAQAKHFGENNIFDQIYSARR
jgi:sulfate transport system substrate-binding protein